MTRWSRSLPTPFHPVFHDGGTTYEFDDEARRASQPRVTGGGIDRSRLSCRASPQGTRLLGGSRIGPLEGAGTSALQMAAARITPPKKAADGLRSPFSIGSLGFTRSSNGTEVRS